MRELVTERVSVTTTGSAGAAAGTGTSPVIHGWIEHIFLDFHASAPATTDVTISFTNRGGNVLATANTATDVLIAPRIKPVDNANSAITNAHARFACNQTLTISVAESDALTGAVVAYITYERV